MRLNAKLIGATLIGALGGLIFGADIAVISGVIDSLTRYFGLSGVRQGLTVAIGPVGTVLGCFVGGVAGQRIGARASLRCCAALYFLAALGAALSPNWSLLLCMRLLSGLGLGVISVLGPVYISELAPAQWRGRLVGAFQINIVTGILLGYTTNYLIRSAALGTLEWRAMLAVVALPAFLFFVLLFRIPLSPRWLVAHHQEDIALAVLVRMGAKDPTAEFTEIQEALCAEHAQAHEPVFRWKYRYPLFLAITIGMFNQLSGINAILYYMHSIFAAAGFSQLSSDLQSIIIGVANLVFTLVGMSVIDHFGRKSLLIVGACGTAVCMLGVAGIFALSTHQGALLGLLLLYIAFFAPSQGAVMWVYLSEVFPTSVRSKGQGVGSASHWITNTIISLFFPVMIYHFGTATPFFFFAGATLVQLIVVCMFYPETKKRTLEQIQRQLVKS
jgi:MFS transporter, SP family, arabinose:H+ symporter